MICEIIRQAIESAHDNGLEPALVLGVIQAESGFKVSAKSMCGACGLMQLMPATAKELGVRDIWGIRDNIRGGCRYLGQMHRKFGRVDLALAAYNAGPGNVQQYKGVPPFEETETYIKRVTAYAQKWQDIINALSSKTEKSAAHSRVAQ